MSGNGANAAANSDAGRERESRSILLVDDESAFRSGVRNLLHKLLPHDEIVEAGGGAEAMEVLSKGTVDCVLLDHDMPGGSGLEWLKRILGVEPPPAVIMVTGRGCEQLAVDAMKNGALDYLVKGSIQPADFQRAITHAMDQVAMKRTIAAQQKDLMEAERQRVMIESLGAACHHIGQPATTLIAYLELMRRQEKSPDMLEMIAQCMVAAQAIGDILGRLRSVSEYRTVPYLPSDGRGPKRSDEQILKI
jgi:DNA-binding NarL/FixJ family response regulator